MTKAKKRSIKISQDMMEVLEDMVLGGGAATAEEALDNIFTDWLIQTTAEMDAEKIGRIAVDSGQIMIADAQSNIKEEINHPEGEFFYKDQIINKYGVDVAVVIDTCTDGFYEVRKENWGDFDRIVIDIPKVNYDSDDGEEDKEDEMVGDIDPLPVYMTEPDIVYAYEEE